MIEEILNARNKKLIQAITPKTIILSEKQIEELEREIKTKIDVDGEFKAEKIYGMVIIQSKDEIIDLTLNRIDGNQ